ncbi:hypothetical protein RJ639_025701 [Escallonia herrerae]|uniref:DUF4219 domain-containing protein n=1 Tax=Escallonia herrerae TaxID=1293975 RepID=A0AA89ACB5_9ASTE|nr:hypothetical protein RJ639_025701 [Escallonia herrerae]
MQWIRTYSFVVELASSIGGVGKLTHINYNNWRSCLETYLQGQYLWDVVNGADTTPPKSIKAMRKWKI